MEKEKYSADMRTVFDAAKVIRKAILKKDKWAFNGSLDGDTIPDVLNSIIRWILAGPKTSLELSLHEHDETLGKTSQHTAQTKSDSSLHISQNNKVPSSDILQK